MNQKNEITKALLRRHKLGDEWFWGWFDSEPRTKIDASVCLVTLIFERLQKEPSKYRQWLFPLALRLFIVLKEDEIQINEREENRTFVSDFEEPENCYHGLLVSAEYCAELGKKLIRVYKEVGSIYSLRIYPVAYTANVKPGLYLIH